MAEEESLEFRSRKIDEARKYFLEEIKHNDLMIEKYKKDSQVFTLWGALAYFGFNNYWLRFNFCICFITFQFLHLLHTLPVGGITSFALGLNIFAIVAGIKNYKSIIKKKNKKYDKILLLGKDKLNTVEVLISKALIASYVSHEEFVSVSNVLKEYFEMKKK